MTDPKNEQAIDGGAEAAEQVPEDPNAPVGTEATNEPPTPAPNADADAASANDQD